MPHTTPSSASLAAHFLAGVRAAHGPLPSEEEIAGRLARLRPDVRSPELYAYAMGRNWACDAIRRARRAVVRAHREALQAEADRIAAERDAAAREELEAILSAEIAQAIEKGADNLLRQLTCVFRGYVTREPLDTFFPDVPRYLIHKWRERGCTRVRRSASPFLCAWMDEQKQVRTQSVEVC